MHEEGQGITINMRIDPLGNMNIYSKLHGNVAISFHDTFTWTIVSKGQGEADTRVAQVTKNDSVFPSGDHEYLYCTLWQSGVLVKLFFG